jgi:hypothetical protein
LGSGITLKQASEVPTPAAKEVAVGGTCSARYYRSVGHLEERRTHEGIEGVSAFAGGVMASLFGSIEP